MRWYRHVLLTAFLLLGLVWAGAPVLNHWLSPVVAAPLRQATPTFRPTRTPFPSPTGTETLSPTLTVTATLTATVTPTAATVTPAVPVTVTLTATPALTPTVSPTPSPEATGTPPPTPELPPVGDRLLTTIGTVAVPLEPDYVEIEIAVETAAPTPVEAFEENQATVQDVLAALVRAGVDRAEVRRVGFEVFTRPAEGVQGAAQPPVQSQTLTIFVQRLRFPVRDADQVAEVLAAATGAGASRVLALDLLPSEAQRERAARQARRLALEEAYAKAREIARLAGLELAGIVTVREQGATGRPREDQREVSAAFEVTFAVRPAR